MYRCNVCARVSPRGMPRLNYVVKRRDGSIERELAVCGECDGKLRSGVPLDRLVRSLNGQASPEALAAARVYPPPAPPAAPAAPRPPARDLLARSPVAVPTTPSNEETH